MINDSNILNTVNFPKILDMQINKQNNIMDIQMEKIDHVTRYTEWTQLQKIECLKFLIKIMLELYDKNIFIKDPHYFNITYKFGFPSYIDLGSFAPISELMVNLESFVINLFMWFNIIEINKNDIEKYKAEILKKECAKDVFNVLKKIYDIIQNINIKESKHSTWSYYCTKIPEDINEYKQLSEQNNKIKIPLNLLTTLKKEEKTIVDIGCNTGFFSFLFDQLGYTIVGCDFVPDVINTATLESKKRNSHTTFCCFDIINPPKEVGYDGRAGFVFDRLKSDICFGAAITHHLFNSGCSFENQANIFSALTKKYLIIEFIPSEDIHMKQLNLPNIYNIDNFIKNLEAKGFKVISIFDSAPAPRKWIYAKKE